MYTIRMASPTCKVVLPIIGCRFFFPVSMLLRLQPYQYGTTAGENTDLVLKGENEGVKGGRGFLLPSAP